MGNHKFRGYAKGYGWVKDLTVRQDGTKWGWVVDIRTITRLDGDGQPYPDQEQYQRELQSNEIILMQYTGIKAKPKDDAEEGRNLFEGDVVGFRSMSCIDALVIGNEAMKYRKAVIKWNEDELCWWCDAIGEDSGFKPDKETDDNQFKYLGNIFDNPELLEEKV